MIGGLFMPKLTIDGDRTVEVPAGKRLVNALTDEGGIDQMHSCGGHAKCTTCRVEFVEPEPTAMTEAEKAVLAERGLLEQVGLRLSCQIGCDRDMSVRVLSRLRDSAKPDPGKRPGDAIEPPPVWTTR
jgi:ferredoxin